MFVFKLENESIFTEKFWQDSLPFLKPAEVPFFMKCRHDWLLSSIWNPFWTAIKPFSTTIPNFHLSLL